MAQIKVTAVVYVTITVEESELTTGDVDARQLPDHFAGAGADYLNAAYDAGTRYRVEVLDEAEDRVIGKVPQKRFCGVPEKHKRHVWSYAGEDEEWSCPGTKITRTATTKPCWCACNAGGFCGGCGHAGCGKR